MDWGVAGESSTEVDASAADANQLAEKARAICLRKLARTPKSVHEIRSALLEQEIPLEIAESVIERYLEVGLLDDEGFALALANTRMRVKGLAKSAVRRELVKRGVAEPVIDRVLGGITTEDELVEAIALTERRFRQVAKLDRAVRYRRLSSFLARKGYSSSVISAAIRQAEASAVNLQS